MTERLEYDVELHELRPEVRVQRITVEGETFWTDVDEDARQAFGGDATGTNMIAVSEEDARQLAAFLGARLDLGEFSPEAVPRVEQLIWALGLGVRNVCERHVCGGPNDGV